MSYKTALVAGAAVLIAFNSVGAGTATGASVQGGPPFRLASQASNYSDQNLQLFGGGGFDSLELASLSIGAGAYSGFHQTRPEIVSSSKKTKKSKRSRRRKNERVPKSLVSTQRPTTTEMSYEDQQLLIAALDEEVSQKNTKGVSKTETDGVLSGFNVSATETLPAGEGATVLKKSIKSGYELRATKIPAGRRLVVNDASGVVLATNMKNPSVPYLQVSTGECEHQLGEFSVIDDPLRQVSSLGGCVDIEGFRDIPQLSKSPWEATVILDLDGMTVAEAVKVVLSIPGYDLLRHGPSVDERTTRMLALPVPRAQRRLRATSVRRALELLAGPRVVVAVDHSARLVAFDQSPVYASLSKKGWRK